MSGLERYRQDEERLLSKCLNHAQRLGVLPSSEHLDSVHVKDCGGSVKGSEPRKHEEVRRERIGTEPRHCVNELTGSSLTDPIARPGPPRRPSGGWDLAWNIHIRAVSILI
jgi:hypothetical protein